MGKGSTKAKDKVSTAKARDNLLRLLRTKYLFGEQEFGDRTLLLPTREVPLSPEIHGFILRSPNGAPFLIAVAAHEGSVEECRGEATRFALTTETIGLVAILDAGTQKLIALRRRFDQPAFEEMPDLEYYSKGFIGPQGILLQDVPTYGEEEALRQERQLLPISNKLENIFFDIHSAMRDIDGLHADEALEELCKLLYVKIFDEELLERGKHQLIHSSCFGSYEEYASSVRKLYREAIEYDLRVYRLKIPQYERSRGVFGQPIKLSSAALTRSYQVIENLSLSKSRSDIKGRAFQKVLGRAVRAGMGQYFTPASICELMVEVVKPDVADLILDPFCGSGHFLSDSLRFVASRTSTSSKQFHEFAFGKLHGIEKSDRMTRIAMTDMRLNGDGHSNIRCTDALLDFANYPDISAESFDVVLTNPPFGSLLGPEALAGLGRFELAQGRKNVPLEVLGLERAIQFLRPGGRMGIVLPDNVLTTDSCQYVREWLKGKACVRAILSLPIESFSPFGANVKTSILFARKWRSGEEKVDTERVCLIKLEAIGYDASGRLNEKTDVPQAISTLNAFLERHGW